MLVCYKEGMGTDDHAGLERGREWIEKAAVMARAMSGQCQWNVPI